MMYLNVAIVYQCIDGNTSLIESNMVELREIPWHRAERGTSGKEGAAGSVLLKPATLPIVRSEVWRSLATCCLSAAHGLRPESGVAGRRFRWRLLTFLGEARKVSAAAHSR